MQKIIEYEEPARNGIMAGIDIASTLIAKTLGPRGKSIISKKSYISNQHGLQHLPASASKDGIGILRNITLDDALQNVGVDLCKSASEKTMSECGDATTTTVVLLQALCKAGLNAIDKGLNPYEVKAGMDWAVEQANKTLDEMAIPVDDDIESIRRIATISANNDPSVGDLIAEAFGKIGADGVIDLEKSHTSKTEIRITEGVRFGRGYVSPYFITNSAKAEVELENPYILLYDKKITMLKQLQGVLDKVMREPGRSLLIVCDDADGEALAAVAMNAHQKRLRACIVKCPEFGDFKRESMEDLAVATGGRYISDEKGAALEKTGVDSLGSAQKVVVTKDETIIISGSSAKGQQTKKLVDDLRVMLAQADGFERERLERRIARLTGGVAVLSVGAPTEFEMIEKFDRCDDAVRATKAAIAEGYVAGGGTAFFRCAEAIDSAKSKGSADFLAGALCTSSALVSPLTQILENANIKTAKAIFESMSKASSRNFGYNAKTLQLGDLVEGGVIDPKKALRVALENAASVAGVLFTTGGVNLDSF